MKLERRALAVSAFQLRMNSRPISEMSLEQTGYTSKNCERSSEEVLLFEWLADIEAPIQCTSRGHARLSIARNYIHDVLVKYVPHCKEIRFKTCARHLPQTLGR